MYVEQPLALPGSAKNFYCHGYRRRGHLTSKLLFSWLQHVLHILGLEMTLFEETPVTIAKPSCNGYYILNILGEENATF